MKPTFLATIVLTAILPSHAASTGLCGTVVDRSGAPLQGVEVRLASSEESTLSGVDGSWHLERTSSLRGKPHGGTTLPGNWSSAGGGFHVLPGGFRADGRKASATSLLALPAPSPRNAASPTDTLVLRWKGLETRSPISPEPTGNQGVSQLDTSGFGHLDLRASRIAHLDMSGIHLELVNFDPLPKDSLVIRLHLDGTAKDLADFATSLDAASIQDQAGFQKSAGLDGQAISRTRPVTTSDCPEASICHWTFDVSLMPVKLETSSRLRVDLIFRRRAFTGDTTGIEATTASHDPYASRDWSFRAHGPSDGWYYLGIPATNADAAGSPPVNPYIQIVRGGHVVYGRGPQDGI
ncbi:MAG TPA: hypothetical protein PKO15_00945 [Fibrobacteria bacterium]|nr:hypothetical protein [Fibrobacteria bacterium]HOX50599.1 hypothetical protein [Fibrobacteria bacterium]